MHSTRLMICLALGLASPLPASASGPIEIVPPELRGAVQPQVAVSTKGDAYVVFGRNGSFYCAASLLTATRGNNTPAGLPEPARAKSA